MSWLCSTLSSVLWDLGLHLGSQCCGQMVGLVLLWPALQSVLVAVIPSSLFMLRYGGVALGPSYPMDQEDCWGEPS